MPRPPIDLHLKVRQVVQHTAPLPPQADCPKRHFEQSTNTGHSLIKYVDDHIDPSDIYEAVYEKHLGHLRRMVLAELIESFERFLKELAAVCIDNLAPYAADDRFDEFVPRGGRIAAFVNANSVGKALCESDTWLKNKTINNRFRALLQDHFGEKWEHLFPEQNQQPAVERARAATLEILWQIRHNLAHNVGVLTHSDSMKLRVLIGGHVTADVRIVPTISDLRYVKRFLVEAAECVNSRIGQRLAELLTHFHQSDPTLFSAQEAADKVSRSFDIALDVNNHKGELSL